MIKLFTEPYYAIQQEVNNWLEENEDTGKIEVTKISQSSCYKSNDGLYVTVMIEYLKLIDTENLPSSDFQL
jgi:hypothetical protein